MEGKRNLTVKSGTKFAKGLKLDESEKQYLLLLIQFEQAKTVEIKTDLAHKIQTFLTKLNIHSLHQAELSYYAHWYHILIRELTLLPDFQEDPKWIQSKIRVKLNETEIQKSIKTLEKLGLIQRDANNKIYSSCKNLNTQNEVISRFVSDYHKTMMKLASESIEAVPKKRRELSAVCLPLSENSLRTIKEKIQNLREEILSLSEQDRQQAHDVYQLNMQLFPLTYSKGDESK